ncbi:MAG: ThuA domain-containing protein [Verrucomicrobiota bacterium]|nr:ThuA domain-containing protein [Verrucomicrobiota bacterium]
MPWRTVILLLGVLFTLTSISAQDKAKLKALIIDGQNNHGIWPKTTVMMKRYLEQTELFSVDVERTVFTWQGDDLIPQWPVPLKRPTQALKEPKADPNFAPPFAQYDVVITNFGWRAAPWPDATKSSLESYVDQGGGLVVVHAADNSFAEWPAYNQMIGLGGWGGRDETFGPYVYYNAQDELVRDTSEGRGGSHGKQHEYLIQTRDADHPITRGLPMQWLHARDELYDRLRGPAEKMHVLATAYSDKETGGTGRHEPMMMTIDYGQGRVYHTPMGHADYSMECVGFILTFQRGAQWAATGKVTLSDIPDDFPDAQTVRQRSFETQK